MKFDRIIATAVVLFANGAGTAVAQESILETPIHICSQLDFNGMQWPNSINDREKDAVALALNISGSFEGETGWVNLTNDFDGQGVSLGLLNQCLGQGSLQPLMIEMEKADPVNMKIFFPGPEFKSLDGMLSLWESRSFMDGGSDLDIQMNNMGFSSLDDEIMVADLNGANTDMTVDIEKKKKLSPNEESVQWAKKTLYADGRTVFNPVWYTSLSLMAASASYRSIQLVKAASIHHAALRLLNHFGLRQLRSYLFFFDVMVQNGGINDKILSNIDGVFRKKKLNETQKLNFILNKRLRFVKAKYRKDVRSRKLALIKGSGKVHGQYRNFDREYCTDLEASVFSGDSKESN